MLVVLSIATLGVLSPDAITAKDREIQSLKHQLADVKMLLEAYQRDHRRRLDDDESEDDSDSDDDSWRLGDDEKTERRDTGTCAAADGFLRLGCASQVASNTTTAERAGGTLYVHDTAGGVWRWSAIIDLGDAAVASGFTPRHKPHMILPSPNHKYVAVSYTSDQFVHILSAEAKQMVACIDARLVPGLEGGLIHTGAWYGDDHFVMVDMTGSLYGVQGGALHKFFINFTRIGERGSWTHEASLAIGPSAVGRGTVGTKPIAIGTNPIGAYRNLYFVTDAKGAGSIVDVTGDMAVVADLPLEAFGACKGGGLWTEHHPEDEEVLIAQYGTQGDEQCLYQINLKEKNITKTYNLPAAANDAHGIAFCKANSTGKFFLLNTNRVSATLDVLDYQTGDLVVDSYNLNDRFMSGDERTKMLMPDTIYYRATDSALYMAARGPSPVSAVKPENFNPNATAGLFKLSLTDCIDPAYGNDAFLLTEADRVPVGSSDVHGVRGVGPTEVWAIDQAATGSVQTYEIFSKCAAYDGGVGGVSAGMG